jgi:peptide deformylase
MAVKKLVELNRSRLKIKKHVLRAISEPIDFSKDDIEKISKDLRDTLASKHRGVGIAAPQIGVSKRIVIVHAKQDVQPIVVINPTVIRRFGGSEDFDEGCLSLPGYKGSVRRLSKIEVCYFDLRGKPQTLVTEGLEARVFNHEIDHLNGVMYTDLMVNVRGLFKDK